MHSVCQERESRYTLLFNCKHVLRLGTQGQSRRSVGKRLASREHEEAKKNSSAAAAAAAATEPWSLAHFRGKSECSCFCSCSHCLCLMIRSTVEHCLSLSLSRLQQMCSQMMPTLMIIDHQVLVLFTDEKIRTSTTCRAHIAVLSCIICAVCVCVRVQLACCLHMVQVVTGCCQ